MTAVLMVVNRFSKIAHFNTHTQVAKKTGVIMVNQVFRLHRLPCDIVSDSGSQFTTRFWAEFCRLLDISVSLSFGFHPQSNGQSEKVNQDLETILQ